MKRAALYCRVSTIDQHPETQLGELRQFAANKGFKSSANTPITDTVVLGQGDPNLTA